MEAEGKEGNKEQCCYHQGDIEQFLFEAFWHVFHLINLIDLSIGFKSRLILNSGQKKEEFQWVFVGSSHKPTRVTRCLCPKGILPSVHYFSLKSA
jgi:hypothetical protein